MNVEKWNLPDGKQSVDIHRRPSHGQVREMERLIWKARDSDTPGMSSEEAAVQVLVESWDLEGGIPFKRESYGDVPADTWALLRDELQTVVDSINPARAVDAVLAGLRSMQRTLKSAEAERLGKLIDEVRDIAGLTDPNR